MHPAGKTTSVPDGRQNAWNDYTREAIKQLAHDRTGYSEQSTGTKKVGGALHPDIVKAIIDEMVATGELDPGEVDVRMIGMTLTGHFGSQSEAEHRTSPATKPSPKQYLDDLARFADQIHFNGVVGIDIGAPEKYRFDELGRDRLTALYKALLHHAIETGQTVVFRPHVGEGVIDTMVDQPFHTDKNRVIGATKDGVPQLPHYERAQHNVEQWVQAFEDLDRAGLMDRKKVIVRFGHVTHATPDQMARLKKLGIIAEINLGSNITSGVLTQTQGIGGPRAVNEQFEDHSFTAAIYYDVETILSTDGNAVMNTSMKEDYMRARQLVEGVLAGDRPVRVRAEDAHGRGRSVPTRPDEREITVSEMTQAERARFQGAYEKVFDDARRYYQRRPKPTHGTTSAASPVGGAHHIDIATSAGLQMQGNHSNLFSGSRDQIAAAEISYRTRSYTVVRVGGEGLLTVVVTSPDGTFDAILAEKSR